MWAVLAAVFFAISWFEHGGAVSVHNHYFDSTGMMVLGLFCVAIHLIPVWWANRPRWW